MFRSSFFGALALLCCCCGPHRVGGLDFGYDGSMGPSHWGEQYNSCDGKYQSPININVLDVVERTFSPLVMEGFDQRPESAELVNNGHTVLANMKFARTPVIQGGPLEGMGVFRFSQFHFHWGDNDTLGSEDRINNVAFPAELHMVFYNDVYQSVNEALAHDGGLVVLAFFFSFQGFDNPNYAELTELLQDVREPNNRATFVSPPKLQDLISTYLRSYFTYNGSLTTPPCSEAVTWIDFEEPILISAQQIERFRNLHTHGGLPLKHNFRPIQPLNNRTIYRASSGLSLPSLMTGDESSGSDVEGAHTNHGIGNSSAKVADTQFLRLCFAYFLMKSFLFELHI